VPAIVDKIAREFHCLRFDSGYSWILCVEEPVQQQQMNAGFTILLAEDNEDDVFLLKTALDQAGIGHPIQTVTDGEKAISYLKGENEYADRSCYSMLYFFLLDIKMPRKNNLEVLGWMRGNGDNGLKRLPVIIMSTSNMQEDIDRAYELGVNAYLVKPHAFDDLVKVLKTTTEFWTGAAHPQV